MCSQDYGGYLQGCDLHNVDAVCIKFLCTWLSWTCVWKQPVENLKGSLAQSTAIESTLTQAPLANSLLQVSLASHTLSVLVVSC